MAISPILFATYLDYLLKRAELCDYDNRAYADDLASFIDTIEEAENLIKKLESLEPYLSLNKEKCGIILKGKIEEVTEIRGIKVVSEYKYLGIHLSKSKSEVITRAANAIKLHAKIIIG